MPKPTRAARFAGGSGLLAFLILLKFGPYSPAWLSFVSILGQALLICCSVFLWLRLVPRWVRRPSSLTGIAGRSRLRFRPRTSPEWQLFGSQGFGLFYCLATMVGERNLPQPNLYDFSKAQLLRVVIVGLLVVVSFRLFQAALQYLRGNRRSAVVSEVGGADGSVGFLTRNGLHKETPAYKQRVSLLSHVTSTLVTVSVILIVFNARLYATRGDSSLLEALAMPFVLILLIAPHALLLYILGQEPNSFWCRVMPERWRPHIQARVADADPALARGGRIRRHLEFLKMCSRMASFDMSQTIRGLIFGRFS